MNSIKVVLAQIDTTVGDVDGNVAKVLRACEQAAALDGHLVIFPEMALSGYPVEDLALRRSFQDACERGITAIATELADRGLADLVVVVGTLLPGERAPRNSAVVISGGSPIDSYTKHHLPNYGVFDEQRIFEAGDSASVVDVQGWRLALAICEDIWQPNFPAADACRAGNADAVVVLNASPYERGKHHQRIALCKERSAEIGVPIAYVALIGGQDELVFDGGSFLVDPSGLVYAHSERFIEELLPVELPPVPRDLPAPLDDLDEVYSALTLGLRDYVAKNNISSVLLGLSGGIDSALVAAIACDALGSDSVHAVAMPSKYSSFHSVADAEQLAANTGLSLRTVPIAPMFDAFQSQLALTGLAEENVQARIRGTTLMAISNAEGHLVLATGNKSEIAVGYSTIYGDAVGGFAPLKDVPKTLVWQLARWRNEQAELRNEVPPIPHRSITKPPSAELRPDQQDTDTLPEYHDLDAIVERYVEASVSAADLVAAGYSAPVAARVLALVDAAEYKRRQYPPGPKITRLAFGRDRRFPITNRWRESAPTTP